MMERKMMGDKRVAMKVASTMNDLSGYGVEVGVHGVTVRFPSNEAVTVKSDSTVLVFDAASEEVANYERGRLYVSINQPKFRSLHLVDGFWMILSGYKVQVSFNENGASIIVSEGGSDWTDGRWHAALQVTIEWVVT